MSPERVFDLITEEWIGKCLINPDDRLKFYRDLNYVYMAGYEAGMKHSSIVHKKKIAKCNKDGQIISIYNSITDAAKDNNCSRKLISDYLNGKIKNLGKRLKMDSIEFKFIDK